MDKLLNGVQQKETQNLLKKPGISTFRVQPDQLQRLKRCLQPPFPLLLAQGPALARLLPVYLHVSYAPDALSQVHVIGD